MNQTLTSLLAAVVLAVLLVFLQWDLSKLDSSALLRSATVGHESHDDDRTRRAAEPAQASPQFAGNSESTITRISLETAIRAVEEAEAELARIEQALDELADGAPIAYPEGDDLGAEALVALAEPLLQQLDAAEEALQQARDAEDEARAALKEG